MAVAGKGRFGVLGACVIGILNCGWIQFLAIVKIVRGGFILGIKIIYIKSNLKYF